MAVVYSGEMLHDSASSHLQSNQESNLTSLCLVRVLHVSLEVDKAAPKYKNQKANSHSSTGRTTSDSNLKNAHCKQSHILLLTIFGAERFGQHTHQTGSLHLHPHRGTRASFHF